jgi:hypothetical protein
MDDPDDPDDPYSPSNLSWNWGGFGRPGAKWRPFSGRYLRGPRVPPPPGPRSRPSKAEREAERKQEMRADARAERLHLIGLSNAGVFITSVVLGAVVVILVLVLVTHH